MIGELDVELTAELIDAFAHRQNSEARLPRPQPTLSTRPDVPKATSVILNLDLEVAVGNSQRYGCSGARGVALDVDKALLHDTEQHSLHGDSQTPHVTDHDFDADAAPLGEARNKPAYRRDQSHLVEQ